MPALRGMQIDAIQAIQEFLDGPDPGRALVQMVTGSGQTHVIVEACARLIRARRASRILILADTRLEVEQVAQWLQRYVRSGESSLTFASIDDLSSLGNVAVTSLQRAARAGEEVLADVDLVMLTSTHGIKRPEVAAFFDRIAAPLIAFTASADARSLDFFGGELLWKNTYQQTIDEGYNLRPRIFRLQATVKGGGPEGLREIRAALTEFRSRLFTEIFPGRTTVPKTLVYASGEAQADAILSACREVFEGDSEFAVKITSSTSNVAELVEAFKLRPNPRVVVTVSMLATGVDLPALECLLFLRDIRSETLYQQMVGRGARLIDPGTLRAVTPDAEVKRDFAVVDAVGVTEEGHFARDSRVPRSDQHAVVGRLVAVADLVSGGVLAPGAYLRLRVSDDGTATAMITDDGAIALLDGRTFQSPSGAATALTGKPVNGWNAWVTEEDDATLHQLRQVLLNAAVDDLNRMARDTEEPQDVESAQRIRCLADLKVLRQEADAGEPQRLSVREFIAIWGARGRDAGLVSRIETDLQNHGLITIPDFRLVTLEDQIVVQLPAAPESTPEVAAPLVKEPVTQPERRPRPTQGLAVGNLPSATRGVEAVKQTGTVEEAITKMLLFDYSQLAVMTGDRNLHGAVTWRSIAKIRHQRPDAPLSAAIVPATEVSYSDDLIGVLPRLADEEFFFVRGPQRTISGIITASDVVRTHGQMTAPFLIVGEIDQTLRWILEDAVDIDMVAALCDADGTRQIDSFARLTMGDYQRVLENPDAWATLGWPLDRKTFNRRLKGICEVRNNIMHFNGDPLPDDVLSMLKNFLTLLREYCN